MLCESRRRLNVVRFRRRSRRSARFGYKKRALRCAATRDSSRRACLLVPSRRRRYARLTADAAPRAAQRLAYTAADWSAPSARARATAARRPRSAGSAEPERGEASKMLHGVQPVTVFDAPRSSCTATSRARLLVHAGPLAPCARRARSPAAQRCRWCANRALSLSMESTSKRGRGATVRRHERRPAASSSPTRWLFKDRPGPHSSKVLDRSTASRSSLRPHRDPAAAP